MKLDRSPDGGLEYHLYRLGRSKTRFRGPKPDFGRPHVACLGSSETFGRFVPRPWPQLLSEQLGVPCANFGVMNAGPELVLRDPTLQLALAEARVTVVAVSGAHTVSNRLYSVHPRRNDRVIRVSQSLTTMFRNVDFTEIHFVRHLLTTLLHADPLRFAIVVDELRMAWTARMATLFEAIEGRIVLLWMAEHAPPDPPDMRVVPDVAAGLGPDPLFVTQQMLDRLSPLVTRVVEVIASEETRRAGRAGMVHAPSEAAAARALPGPALHAQAARALLPVIAEML